MKDQEPLSEWRCGYEDGVANALHAVGRELLERSLSSFASVAEVRVTTNLLTEILSMSDVVRRGESL